MLPGFNCYCVRTGGRALWLLFAWNKCWKVDIRTEMVLYWASWMCRWYKMGLLTKGCCWLCLPVSWKGEMRVSKWWLFLFHLILQDLSIKIARGGFKWCSSVLSTESVPHHQVVWKYPLPLSALLGDRWVGVWWEKLKFGWHCFSCCSAQETPVFSHMAWIGVGSWTFAAIQSKTVMETAAFRGCNYHFGIADLFWG